MKEMDLIATATFGLEAVVAREVRALGYETTEVEQGRVAFRGDAEAICRANLWLRSADRVLIRVDRFDADDFDALFEQTRALPWHEWIPPDGAFPVDGRSVRSRLSSVPAIQRTVKKAIVEKMLAGHGVGELPETGPTHRVAVALLKDRVTLTLDTTGAGLHKRGYRTGTGMAPLKETLAAALVQLSFWKPDRPLIDPFCGSGTICVEAALIGRNIAPGLNRRFAAESWPTIDGAIWSAQRQAARNAIEPTLPLRIEGYDIDERSLRMARQHAEQAGVAGDIHFQMRDFRELSSKRPYGCVITNPPYGKRVSDFAELEPLYREMPGVLRTLPTWSHYVFTAYPQFERLIGQEADRRRKLYNGRIECTYYQFHGPKPGAVKRDDDQTGPAFGGLPEGSDRQAEEFANRLVKRARHLRRWPTRRGITCYRLYDRDVPDVPLVVDRYEDHLHIGEYERPNEHTAAQHDEWLELMKRAAAEALEVEPAKVFMKYRSRQRGDSQHEKYARDGYTIEAYESGLKFAVNLSDYVDTGLFLDHRVTRSMVRERAEGKRVLNLFCYTGAFSVYAAAGGAAATTSVDLSNTYLEWTQRNLAINGFTGDRHRLVRDDVVAWVAEQSPGAHYDLAVIDPPTFSNSKRTEQDWRVERDYAELIAGVVRLMSPGGEVFFSTNFRRFKMDEAALPEGLSIREISQQTVPEDFRNQRIHRCWLIQVP